VRLAEAAAAASPDTEAPAQPALFAAPASTHQPAAAAVVIPASAGVPVVASSATFYPAPNRNQQ